MTTLEFLSYLRSLDIRIWREGDRLRFNAPDGTMTPELRADLVNRKAEILAFLRQTEAPPFTPPPLRPVPRDKKLPLSFAQQRLWFLDQFEPDSSFYNVPEVRSLTGQLDVDALARSFTEMIRRHQVLRTTFTTLDGEPVPVIHPEVDFRFTVTDSAHWDKVDNPFIDLRHLPPAEREVETRRLAVAVARRPFELSQGPLLRALLLCVGAEHLLLASMHHIISDAWSVELFIQEISALYDAFVNGRPSPLPELPIQYVDFACWQREWLQGQALETQLAYWKEQLGDPPPVLQLPTDRPRPSLQTFNGASQSFTLPAALSEPLQRLSRQAEATLFMTLLTAFKVLLHRYTGQTDISVGSPIANRNRPELEGLIGFFMNTLVLRTNLEGNPTFRELLGRVREMTLGAYAHQDLPFEMLVKKLGPARDLSHPPLFQVMFTLQNAPAPATASLDPPLKPLKIEMGTAKFDLTLSLVGTAQGLIGTVEYNTDLFEAGTISRLQRHFQTLLESIVADPEQRLSELTLMTGTECEQLLVTWNNTQRDYPRHHCIHELVEAQAAQTPDRAAVIFEDEQLTYQALNQRANQLAHCLRRLNVGPDSLVGIGIDRSLEMVIGVLGILKAGGAYVPLDPAYPQERLAFMLKDANISVMLTRKNLIADPQASSCNLPIQSLDVVCLDRDWPTIGTHSNNNVAVSTTPDHLAYVIYTSGSTGRPKGVAMPHRPLVNLMVWQRQNSRLTGQGCTLQFAPLSFDVSCQELFATWCAGGTLVLIPDAVRRDATALLQALIEKGVERLFLPFVGLQHLAEAVAFSGLLPERLREVMTAGEQLQISPAIANLFKRLDGCKLYNQYGPTEGHVVTAFTLTGSPDTWPALPPIGRPIDNVKIYLLDEHLGPVPVGVPGELYIGGVSVVRGYIDRSALTAERFIPDPFSQEPSRRLYRTGDLARYLPDGDIEFMGRNDAQVKVRGFRIEPGEIEAVLAQHPTVLKSAVLTREDEPGNKWLVAYVVPAQGQTVSAGDWRDLLKEKLPDYMVPSAFVILESLPLTPSGKIDRRALPAPSGSNLDQTETIIAPRDTLELGLVRIWEELLGIEPIGVTHDFFEIGGHSLLAVRLVTRIEQDLGQKLPLTTLFQGATVEHLASALRQHEAVIPSPSSLVCLQAGKAERQPLFFIHPGGGHVFCYLDLVRHLEPDQPFYGLQAQGLDDTQEPHTHIEIMAGHYIQLLRAVQPEGPYLLGGWSMGGVVAYEMAQQLQAQGQTIALLTLIDSYAPAGDDKPEVDELALLTRFALDLGLPLDQFTLGQDNLLKLEPEDRLACVLTQAQRSHILPPDIDLAQARRLFHVFKTNFQAMIRYAPCTYSDPVALFKAEERVGVEKETANLGWQALATGRLAIHTVPGDHYTMMREPHVATLAEKIQSLLTTAAREQKEP